jgi:Mg2+ and Co2+ transporter CorA
MSKVGKIEKCRVCGQEKTIFYDSFSESMNHWRVRNIINFLVHNEHDKEEIKYVEMVYDDISQLIDFVESYEGTINSIRELYVAKVSLQINDTIRVLTIFTGELSRV